MAGVYEKVSNIIRFRASYLLVSWLKRGGLTDNSLQYFGRVVKERDWTKAALHFATCCTNVTKLNEFQRR